MIYLTTPEMLHIADRVLNGHVDMRDPGLLEAALARPQATAYGEDAYPTLTDKAAALLQSTVNNHALIDGNKRLGLAALVAFLGMNGVRLTYNNAEAYDLVMAVATGELSEVADISRELDNHTQTW